MSNIIIYVLLCLSLVLNVISLVLLLTKSKGGKLSEKDKNDIAMSFNANIDILSKSITDVQKVSNDSILEIIKTFQANLTQNSQALENRVMELTKRLDERMEEIRQSNERHLRAMQEDNNRQLDKMRETVDEKLAKTINERFEQSFKVLSNQLESVYKSLGEMQNIASDVGSLTKMLSNVKTTGIFGEIQLGAIIEQMLTSEQYETNFITGEGREPVEYAIKLPGQNEGEFVYLPVDSKFPYTIYNDLQTAYEKNDFEGVKIKKEQLKNKIKSMAKDINTKYICPPKSTNFAIMFLPIEGLYSEVAKMGLIEELQATYNVTIAGPTTMSALLNSLQMGFKTLAIQKKSGEVWKILGAVKTEFEKYNLIVEKIRGQFERTSKDFDTLVGTRARLISSKLRTVEKLDSAASSSILGIEDATTDSDEEE